MGQNFFLVGMNGKIPIACPKATNYLTAWVLQKREVSEYPV